MGFVSPGEYKDVEMASGVVRRVLTAGERAMAVRIQMAGGSSIPTHNHPHEQVGFVVSGTMELTIAGETRLVREGDGYAIPSGTPHSVFTSEDCVAIDIFSPLRTEYLG